MKEPKEKINIETLLASIVLPRLIFADKEEKGVFAFTEGLLFCSEREGFCPAWIKFYFEIDLQENLGQSIQEDRGFLPGSAIIDRYPFRGYTAAIEVSRQETKGEEEQQEVYLKSIKRFF